MLLLLKMRVVFADDACLICLTPFIELLDVHKITFATCQHTVCMSCLSKHLMSETTMKTMTPCCRQNFNLCITAQDSVEESFLKTFCLGPSHRMPIDLFETFCEDVIFEDYSFSCKSSFLRLRLSFLSTFL